MTDDSETPMSKTVFAGVMGVDKSQVTRWARMGMPVRPDGRLDPQSAAEWVRRNVDPTQRAHRSVGAAQQRRAERQRHINERQEAIDAFDAIGRLGLWFMCQFTPFAVAEAAVELGIPVPQARALYDRLLVRLPELADELRERMTLPPGELGPFTRPGGMKHQVEWDAPRWAALAASPPTRLPAPSF